MVFQSRALLLAASMALSVIAGSATAATIVNTGTPPAPFRGGGYSLINDFMGNSQFLAGQFSVASDTVLTDLEGFVGSYNGGTFHIGLALGDDVPGETLFLAQVTAPITSGSWLGVHGVNWAVTAGVYWLYFAVLPADVMGTGNAQDTLTRGFMPTGAPNALLNYAAASSGSVPAGWSSQDGLAVGVRVFDNSPSLVPEPGAWALMILGLGLGGGALRRRARYA